MDEDYYNSVLEELIRKKLKKLIKGGVNPGDILYNILEFSENPRDRQNYINYMRSIREKSAEVDEEIKDRKKELDRISDIIEKTKSKIPVGFDFVAHNQKIRDAKAAITGYSEDLEIILNQLDQKYSDLHYREGDVDRTKYNKILREIKYMIGRVSAYAIAIDTNKNKLKQLEDQLQEVNSNESLLSKLESEKKSAQEKIKKIQEKKEQEEQKLESRRKLVKEVNQKVTLDKKLESLATNILPYTDSTKLKKRKNIRK
jgi:chromosome segregation ATPase